MRPVALQAVEKLVVSKLLVEGSNRRIYNVDYHMGMVSSVRRGPQYAGCGSNSIISGDGSSGSGISNAGSCGRTESSSGMEWHRCRQLWLAVCCVRLLRMPSVAHCRLNASVGRETPLELHHQQHRSNKWGLSLSLSLVHMCTLAAVWSVMTLATILMFCQHQGG